MPGRIQLRRTSGWRKPEGAISVARPTPWGNPFWHAQKFYSLDLSLALYSDMIHGFWNPALVDDLPNSLVRSYYEDRAAWLKRMGLHPTDVARMTLVGHDLACWCPIGSACHADLLLTLANDS